MRQLICVLFALSGAMAGAEPAQRTYLAADYSGNRVALVNRDGRVEWDMPAPAACEVWGLPNGNVLYSWTRGVREATRERQVVWEYQAAANEEIYSCQRLDNGDTLIGELASCRAIEVAPDGRTVHKEVKLPVGGAQHGRFRNLRKLANGHYLFGAINESTVKEVDGDGKLVWSVKVPGQPFGASRLANGNTLVACGDGHQIVELDASGKVVWQVGEHEAVWVDEQGRESVVPLRFVAGLERLPNGNTLVCNWLGHGHIGHGPHLIELTPSKRVVWRQDDHQQFKTIASVFLLGVEGVQR